MLAFGDVDPKTTIKMSVHLLVNQRRPKPILFVFETSCNVFAFHLLYSFAVDHAMPSKSFKGLKDLIVNTRNVHSNGRLSSA